FAGMSGALQILPAYEYGRAVASGPLASRWAGAAEPVPKPASLPGIVFPNNHAQFDPFIGVAALALAAIGFACAWRDARVRSMAGVMAGVMAGLKAALLAVISAGEI